MKKYYKIPVTEVTKPRFQFRLLDDDASEPGQIHDGLGNENKSFEEDINAIDAGASSNLWDD